MKIETVMEALIKNRYSVHCFSSGEEAADYLDRSLNGKVIGFGDSATMSHMKLYERLSAHNTVYDPNQSKDNDEFLEIAQKCLTTEVFLTSVNAMSETGELVNIDGTGNRIAGSLFGHEKVYFIISTNKIEPTLEKAVWRARNIAAPKNAMRYKLRTPCAVKGDRCYDCSSPDRICNALTIHMKKMNDIEDVEIVLINEELGF
ncbi:lactate utilization protein [Anaerovorax odorimutans]|uniref:Lactate utilization protein n=1 Tax=Anaerovorax odorimutans TaxID=109327 RepID=A0ABT1RS71_9FIRM|nr:lactate utilization protein [Anaerovorax odorimutans]MCQ4637721.1 lactate utilization protein [Anaerovorax odorimutans]